MLVVLLVVLGVISVAFTFRNPKAYKREVIFVSYKELLSKIDSKDSFLLLISRKECMQCKAVKSDFSKSKFDFGKQVYCMEYSEKDREVIVPKLQKKFKNIECVPYVTEIKNGKQTRYYQNFRKFNDIKNWYIQN